MAGSELRERVRDFVDRRVIPVEAAVEDAVAAPDQVYPEVLMGLREEVREAGLWNLFLDPRYGGTVTQSEYAPLCMEMGRSPAAPYAFNCAAPDTGNAEILSAWSTDAQRAELLEPLLEGRIRSAFSMTEPDIAGSDPTTMKTRAVRDGDGWVINGRKWFTTGAEGAAFVIVMAVTDPDGPRHRRCTLFVVPAGTPGLNITRSIPVLGHDGFPGHAEVRYEDVRVDDSARLGELGGAFAIAQERLRPGRLHHCMRGIGFAERALELLVARARERELRGRTLAEYDSVGELIAACRVEIEGARLLTLEAVARLEAAPTGADRSISIAKIAVPEMCQKVVDRAIQVHGGLGVSGDSPLTSLAREARTLRLVDGADAVHRSVVARAELKASAAAA
ncbi:MAG TPA: acyl-CoA dehydrogenase family protein [Solirubrobacterales bacterium]|nr:acyl-CoA dehydrogenase family protein [Solirubrobacterales bacterium]